MEVSDFDPFVVTFPNALSPEFCQEVIDRFEADPRAKPGITGAGYDPDVKQSMDLHISVMEGWEEFDKLFFESVNSCLKEYQAYVYNNFGGALDINCDHGYQVQKTVPGGFYKPHNDSLSTDPTRERILTYIWYLNEPEEGHTHFTIPDKTIKPETGKLLFFPATWTYMHQGLPPASDKYICTGWLAYYYPKDGEIPSVEWQKHQPEE